MLVSCGAVRKDAVNALPLIIFHYHLLPSPLLSLLPPLPRGQIHQIISICGELHYPLAYPCKTAHILHLDAIWTSVPAASLDTDFVGDMDTAKGRSCRRIDEVLLGGIVRPKGSEAGRPPWEWPLPRWSGCGSQASDRVRRSGGIALPYGA